MASINKRRKAKNSYLHNEANKMDGPRVYLKRREKD